MEEENNEIEKTGTDQPVTFEQVHKIIDEVLERKEREHQEELKKVKLRKNIGETTINETETSEANELRKKFPTLAHEIPYKLVE